MITQTELIPAKAAETTLTAQYTATDRKAVIHKFTATNTGAGAATLSVYLVSNGGTAGAGNLIVNARSIAAGECYTCPELVLHVLNAGGFISTVASAAGVTIRASGVEIT